MQRAARQLGTQATSASSSTATGAARFGFASKNFYASFLAALEIDREPERYFGRLRRDPPEDPERVILDHYYRPPPLAAAFGVSRRRAARAESARQRIGVDGSAGCCRQGYELRVPRDPLRAAPKVVLARVGERSASARRCARRGHAPGAARRDALRDRAQVRRLGARRCSARTGCAARTRSTPGRRSRSRAARVSWWLRPTPTTSRSPRARTGARRRRQLDVPRPLRRHARQDRDKLAAPPSPRSPPRTASATRAWCAWARRCASPAPRQRPRAARRPRPAASTPCAAATRSPGSRAASASPPTRSWR